ncbi:MAG: XdhC family protein [Methylococcaceae bacterium]|nr:XdhC family protein [Methylococcaceae bacterium]
MSKINRLIAAYRQLQGQNEPFVLATIVETAGSTYQKAGARMLIARGGELNGLLGGGCFEGDLVEHARSVFETGAAKTVFYDMRSPDDEVWGLGLGCNGAVRIFLQLLTAADDFSPLNIIADAGEAHQEGLLVTICESDHPDFPVAHSLFLPASSIEDRQLSSFPFGATNQQTTHRGKPRLEAHAIGGQTIKAFYDPIQPSSQLLILGAGDDAMPLAQCAKALGWRVSIADHRPAYLNETRFPQADLLLHLRPETLGRHLNLNHFSAAVLMTHNIDHDRRFLAALADSTIPFVGLLGPAHRGERLLQSLENVGERLRERTYGPVGLDIGAETPEEIALSIMAGIHAELKDRSGGQLSPRGSVYLHDCLPR